MGLSCRLRKAVQLWFNPCSLWRKDFCLLKGASRGMEQFFRWAKKMTVISCLVFSGEEEITALSCTKAWINVNGKEHPHFWRMLSTEHIACLNRLEKCWRFGCSELFLEQFDRVTSWETFQPGASGFASFIFEQSWCLKPVLRSKCWKEGSPMASL